MLNKTVSDYLKDRGCSFVDKDYGKDNKKISSITSNNEILFGFTISENGDTDLKVVTLIIEESDFEKQQTLFKLAKKVEANYSLLVIKNDPKNSDYYWFNNKTSLPVKEEPAFQTKSKYLVKKEDIINRTWKIADILRNNINIDNYLPIITGILMVRSYMEENDKIDQWSNLNGEEFDNYYLKSLDYYKLDNIFKLEGLNRKVKMKLINKSNDFPPVSKAYNDILIQLVDKKTSKRSEIAQHGSSSDFKSILIKIIKSLNIKPKEAADITSGFGFDIRSLSNIYQDSNFLSIEVNKEVATVNRAINIITRADNIKVQNKDSLKYKTDKKFDLIILEPPMGFRKKDHDYEGFKVLEDRGMISDAFVEQAINFTKESGYIVTVVSEGVLFSKMHKSLRDLMFKRTDIKGIISLPANVFNYTSIKTSILVLQKKSGLNDYPDKFFAADIKDLSNVDNILEAFNDFINK